jgi:hypothetical protein
VVVASAAALASAVFFLAPVSYWYSQPGPPPTHGYSQIDAYRSLGCELLVIGDAYYTPSSGFAGKLVLSCQMMVP